MAPRRLPAMPRTAVRPLSRRQVLQGVGRVVLSQQLVSARRRRRLGA